MAKTLEKHEDRVTLSYFDKNTPSYTAKRYEAIIDFINREKKDRASLLDVGCGDGTVLKAFKDNTDIIDFTGMDISENYLRLAKDKLDCNTFNGSIVEVDFIKKIDRRFDYVVLGAILHHLIGSSREESKELSQTALKSAFSLLSKDGYLIISEPTYSPKESMDKVFNIKNFITKFTSERLNILGYENNIGAPVVSYYDRYILMDMMRNITSKEPVFKKYDSHNIGLLLKLIGVKETGALLLIYQK